MPVTVKFDPNSINEQAQIIQDATPFNDGVMSKAQAKKLDGIPAGGGSGGVSAVSGTAPIVSSGGATPAISITPATTLAAGSMSAADKAKLDAITGLSSFRAAFPPATAGTTYVGAAGGSVFAIPIWVPPDVTNVRIRLQNMSDTEGAYADVPGVNVAVGPSDGNADFASAPTVLAGITVGGVVPYVSAVLPNATRGIDGRILVAVSVPAGVTVQAASGGNYTGRLNTGTTTVSPLGGAAGTQGTWPYTMQLEYDTTTSRVVVIGDSIALGYAAYWDLPGLGVSPYIGLGVDHGLAVYNYCVDGARLYNYFDDVQSEMSASTFQIATDLASVIKGAIVIVEVGINDVPFATVAGGVTCFSSYKALIYKAVNWLRANGAAHIICETLSAASSYEGANGPARVQYCDWIATLPFGIDAIIDRDLVLSTAARTAGTTLKAAYDSGDGVHPNALGEAALEAAAYAVVSNYI